MRLLQGHHSQIRGVRSMRQQSIGTPLTGDAKPNYGIDGPGGTLDKG